MSSEIGRSMADSEIKLRETAQTGMSGSDGGKAVIRFDSQFLRIEELIKGKSFSREEISHLLDVLNSRLDTELEKEPNAGAGGSTDQAMKISGIDRTPTGERHHLLRQTTSGIFSETLNIPEGVGASPIDIARAYMAGRSSEQGQNLYGYKHKVERAEPSSNYTQQPLMLSPLSRPAICWPGAMVDDHHGHMKQPSYRNRIGSRGYPRTPYSRTVFPGSSNKVKSTPDGADDYGFGPIRRIRNKLLSDVRPREPRIFSESKEILAEVLKSNARSNDLPDKKNLEPGETSGAPKCLPYDNALGFYDKNDPIAHSSSSQTAGKMLEHLGQNKPMVKEKEAAFKLLTSRGEEHVSSFHSVEVAPGQNAGLFGLDIPDEFHSCYNKANPGKKICEEGVNIAKYADKENPKAPRSVFTNSGIISGANSVASFGLDGYSIAAVKDSKETALNNTKHDRENRLSNGMDVEAVADSTMGSSKNHRSKPSLRSIFVNKPENGPAFTFPVSSASSGGLSEPPTPSIMPTSTSIQPEFSGMPTSVPSFNSGASKPPTPSILPTSTNILSEPSGMSNAAPSFSFGKNDSTPRLAFSFPSTSNTSINDAAPPPKFTFGSDNKARLSFSSFQCH